MVERSSFGTIDTRIRKGLALTSFSFPRSVHMKVWLCCLLCLVVFADGKIISSSDVGFRVTGRYEVGPQAEFIYDWSGVVIEFLVTQTTS